MANKTVIRLSLARLPSEIQRRYGTIHDAQCVLNDGEPIEMRIQVYADDPRVDVWRMTAGVWCPVRKSKT